MHSWASRARFEALVHHGPRQSCLLSGFNTPRGRWIGLVVFAGKAFTRCPLTLDYGALLHVVDGIELGAIEDGTGPYQAMSPADRQKLLADVKTMDQNASVTISVPQSLRPGQEAQITAQVKGGHGIVGVLLVDTDLRFQARPLQSDGWLIVGAPKIWGTDGKEQTRWVDSRAPGLKKNLNSAIIFGQVSDLAAGKFADSGMPLRDSLLVFVAAGKGNSFGAAEKTVTVADPLAKTCSTASWEKKLKVSKPRLKVSLTWLLTLVLAIQ